MNYPLATRGSPTAWTYGNHPTDLPLALVIHTTETRNWAGFKLGRTAPHYSYKATTREWRWHGAPLGKRVGTMRSSMWTRTPANEKAIQVEIIAYSNKAVADKYGGLWVGNFTNDHYQDLAAFVAWVSQHTTIRSDHVTPTPLGGWRSGSDSRYRLDRQDWLDFDGMTAHGAVTGQSHWDTGILDLQRISDYAHDPLKEDEMFQYPVAYGDDSEAVAAWQEYMNKGGGGLKVDGEYGDATARSVKNMIGGDGRLIDRVGSVGIITFVTGKIAEGAEGNHPHPYASIDHPHTVPEQTIPEQTI